MLKPLVAHSGHRNRTFRLFRAAGCAPRDERRGGAASGGCWGGSIPFTGDYRIAGQFLCGQIFCGCVGAAKARPSPPITSVTNGCGVAAPVQVTHVDGIKLSQPATLDCSTATAPASMGHPSHAPRPLGRDSAAVTELRVPAHYVCRTRNHRPGARHLGTWQGGGPGDRYQRRSS